MNGDITATKFSKEYTFIDKVFFYLSAEGFPHLSICLAEGFKELGIEFYSNINFWQLSPDREDYLFRHEPNVTPEDCSVIVLNKDWLFFNGLFPEVLFQPNRNYITVYLDDMDDSQPSLYSHISEKFDFIFKTHCNSGTQYPDNHRPWGFGLSNRILQETRIIPNFEQRRRTLLANFRVLQDRLRVSNRVVPVDQGWLSVEQGVIIPDYPLRQLVRDYLFPIIQEILPVDDTVESLDSPPTEHYHYLQWQQTGNRHYPSYYERMKAAAACATFGGWIVPNQALGKTFAEWWDSWRFWESLVAGCVTFHVDFEKYGMLLPVMPENWQHYIGINLDDIQNTISRLTSQPEILEKISTQGRQWAIENYSPVPTALRFLDTISSSRLVVERSSKVEESALNLQTNALPLDLGEINLLIFPDWSASEESLHLNLERAIRAIATHPDSSKMALLIMLDHISHEEADIALSGIILNLFMQDELEAIEEPGISLIGQLDGIQWKALLNLVQARIVLEKENQHAIAAVKAENIPACEPERLSQKRAVQLETGSWVLQPVS